MTIADPDPLISILLVDNHVVMRQGLRMLIENSPGMKVVAEAASCEEALEAAARTVPDVVLLDLDLGSGSGADIIPQLVLIDEKVHVLVLTGVREPELHRRAIRQGAVGIVMKEQSGEILIKALRRVCAGEVWINHSMTAIVLHELRNGPESKRLDTEAARVASLTPREREVVALIAQGLRTARIAGELFISEYTVRNHLKSIFDKLMVSDRLELATYAVRHGLLTKPG
jgi:two-component system, NarL family, nitrate/nitrite response regulator NarL